MSTSATATKPLPDVGEILRLAEQGMLFYPTTNGMSRSDWSEWQAKATNDPSELKGWIAQGYSLVAVSRLDGQFVLDIDDRAKCEALGMPDPGVNYLVGSPSGGEHGYGLHDDVTRSLGNLVVVYDPDDIAAAKADKRVPNKILELKLNRQSTAAPTAHRFGQKNKSDGWYRPLTPGAELGRGLSPEFLTWLKQHGTSSSMASKDAKPPEFHDDFMVSDFLEAYECTESRQGMVNGWLHVVPESCPECGRPSGESTVAAARCKFMFSDSGWSYRCHMCGATRSELEAKYGAYDGEMFAPGDDWAAVEEADDNPVLTPESSAAFLNQTDDDEMQIQEARKVVTVTTFALTDLGNGERFKWRYGHEFAWTSATGWLHYESGCWRYDKDKAAERAMHAVVRKIQEEAELCDDEEIKKAFIGWAKKSESHSKIEAGLACASALLAKDYGDFDQKPHQLNCVNGTLDMETWEFRKHNPDDLLTRGTGWVYDPAVKCPKHETFVSQIMGGNAAKINYLKRAGGYTLSDETGEQDVFIPHGTGGTGKTTFLTILKGIMGDYAKTADAEMFMLKRGDSGQPFDLAGLEGTRALLAVETEENKHLAVAKVKRMTGGDEIRACYKHRDWYEFKPVWKIWLATNEFPHTPASDDAAWDRLKPVPFTVKFRDTAEEIKDLANKLVAEEGSGILNWFLDGYRDWKANGLKEPDEVKIAAEQLREVEDWLGRFLEEHVEKTDDQREFVTNEKMFQRVDKWAWDTKEVKNLTMKKFAAEMKKRGHETKPIKDKGKTVRMWIGLKLKDAGYQPQTVDAPPFFNPNDMV